MNTDKCQLVLHMIDKVDYYWNFLYVSTAVVIGCILGKDLLTSSIVPKILLVGVYAIFLLGNLFDHLRAYKFLIELLDEIRKDKEVIFCNKEIQTALTKRPNRYVIDAFKKYFIK